MSEELKPLPCPFCGEQPETFPSGDGKGTMIECITANCVNPCVSYYGKGNAALVWNTRSQPHVAQTDSEDDARDLAERDVFLYGQGFYRTSSDGAREHIPLSEITILRSQTPTEAAIENIARMKLFPDDVINRTTLLAAIRLAQQAVQPLTPQTSDRRSGDADQTSSPSTSSVGINTVSQEFPSANAVRRDV